MSAGKPPNSHLEADDLMLYALEMAPADEGQDAAAQKAQADHLSDCAECREELAAIRAALGVYALGTTPEQAVPAGSRERLMAAVAASPRDDGAREPVHSLTAIEGGSAGSLAAGREATSQARGARRLSLWIGWATAAALAVTAGHFYQDRETLRQELSAQADQLAQLSTEGARARRVLSALTDRSAQRVTLVPAKAQNPAEPTARATYDAGSGTLIFLASHLAPLDTGKTYELWLIPADGTSPQPAGTFRPDDRGNASVILPKLQKGVAAKAFGVTVEKIGGSQAPTLPILLAGS